MPCRDVVDVQPARRVSGQTLGARHEMTIDEYATNLGKFWINFNSLELLLRLYLTKRNKESEVGLELDVGSSCPLSHLTNYDSFQVLVAKYNDIASEGDRINMSDVVRLRDAIAHGRATTKEDVPVTLVKFSRPRSDNTVEVTFKEVLTIDFLDRCRKEMRATILSLAKRVEDEFPGTRVEDESTGA